MPFFYTTVNIGYRLGYKIYVRVTLAYCTNNNSQILGSGNQGQVFRKKEGKKNKECIAFWSQDQRR